MVMQPLWIAYGASFTLGPEASYVVFHETEFSFVRLKADWTFDITPNRKQFTSGSWYSLMSGFCTGFRFETTTHEAAQAGLKLMLLLPWEELWSQVHTTMSGCGFYFLPSVCVYELDLICQEHEVTSPFIYFLINHIFMPVSTFGYLFYSWG